MGGVRATPLLSACAAVVWSPTAHQARSSTAAAAVIDRRPSLRQRTLPPSIADVIGNISRLMVRNRMVIFKFLDFSSGRHPCQARCCRGTLPRRADGLARHRSEPEKSACSSVNVHIAARCHREPSAAIADDNVVAPGSSAPPRYGRRKPRSSLRTPRRCSSRHRGRGARSIGGQSPTRGRSSRLTPRGRATTARPQRPDTPAESIGSAGPRTKRP